MLYLACSGLTATTVECHVSHNMDKKDKKQGRYLGKTEVQKINQEDTNLFWTPIGVDLPHGDRGTFHIQVLLDYGGGAGLTTATTRIPVALLSRGNKVHKCKLQPDYVLGPSYVYVRMEKAEKRERVRLVVGAVFQSKQWKDQGFVAQVRDLLPYMGEELDVSFRVEDFNTKTCEGTATIENVRPAGLSERVSHNREKGVVWCPRSSVNKNILLQFLVDPSHPDQRLYIEVVRHGRGDSRTLFRGETTVGKLLTGDVQLKNDRYELTVWCVSDVERVTPVPAFNLHLILDRLLLDPNKEHAQALRVLARVLDGSTFSALEYGDTDGSILCQRTWGEAMVQTCEKYPPPPGQTDSSLVLLSPALALLQKMVQGVPGLPDLPAIALVTSGHSIDDLEHVRQEWVGRRNGMELVVLMDYNVPSKDEEETDGISNLADSTTSRGIPTFPSRVLCVKRAHFPDVHSFVVEVKQVVLDHLVRVANNKWLTSSERLGESKVAKVAKVADKSAEVKEPEASKKPETSKESEKPRESEAPKEDAKKNVPTTDSTGLLLMGATPMSIGHTHDYSMGSYCCHCGGSGYPSVPSTDPWTIVASPAPVAKT